MAKEQSPILKAVDELKERVSVLEEKLAAPVPAVPAVPAPTSEPVEPKPEAPRYPIPVDFVEVVDLTLNKNFGIKYEPLRDSSSFQFTIEVPEKYSPNKPTTDLDGKPVRVEDVRTKVISNSDGVNGVRLWAEKVFATFDADTQFRVVEDRPFANRPI